MATTPMPASAANDTRHPACWPSHVPAGTPSTAASEPPESMTLSARPRTFGENRLAVVGATIDQNSAWLSAVRIRDTSSVG